jgi:outer membrane protein assembly factor BamB
MKKTVILLLIAAALMLSLPAVASAQQADEWSQYQKDVAHTGAIQVELPGSDRVARRTADITAVDGSQPVVAGSNAYVYSGISGSTGTVYCFDMKTGSEVWHTAVAPVSANASWSSPAVADGVVYIASGSKVQALNGASGAILWTKDLTTIKANADVVNSSPAIDGNRLIIGDFANGCYYCLDTANSGRHLWTFSLDAGCLAMSTACITGGRVFVGQGAAFGAPVNPNGKVWCVDESTGKAVTAWGHDGYFTTVGKLDATGTVTAFGDFVYFTDFTYGAAATPNCNIYCLSKSTGTEAWKKPVYGSDGAPAVTDGLVVTSGQQAGAWPTPGTNWTSAFSADTTLGKNPVLRWTRSGIGGPNMSPCIGTDGKIAVGNTTTSWPTTSTDTSVLEPSDGRTLWHSLEGGSAPVATQYGLLSIADGKMVTFGTGALPNGDFYFAEGTTRDGYQEWICLQNPTGARVKTRIEYMINGGGNKVQEVTLPPTSRTTVDVNLSVGPGLDVSARVTGDGHFVAERSVYFAANGINGGEQVMGEGQASKKFMFAEGTTRDGFQTWLALQNPQDAEANVLLTYVYADGTPPSPQNVILPPRSRQTVDVNVSAGAGKDVSTVISANRPIVAERVMYFTYPGTIMGAKPSGVHNSTGADAGATSWYFAEGTTRGNFNEWLCLMNPTNKDATVKIQYLKASGSALTVEKTLKANSRTTVDVNADVGPDQDVSALVTSGEPIVAERPMYFQFIGGAGEMWKGGHNSTGARYAAYRWELAEGCTREGFQTYLCIANPNASEQKVTIQYFITKPDGSKMTRDTAIKIPAGTRKTVAVNDAAVAGADVSATVTCAAPVVVERPMYFSFDDYTDGGVSLGLPGAP